MSLCITTGILKQCIKKMTDIRIEQGIKDNVIVINPIDFPVKVKRHWYTYNLRLSISGIENYYICKVNAWTAIAFNRSFLYTFSGIMKKLKTVIQVRQNEYKSGAHVFFPSSFFLFFPLFLLSLIIKKYEYQSYRINLLCCHCCSTFYPCLCIAFGRHKAGKHRH
jgi:hypothetical protein